MSGPAVLKLSAWGARILHDKNYHFVNWQMMLMLMMRRKTKRTQEHAKKAVSKKSPFDFPNRLWESLVLRD
jgi:predicted flavoprotein YhiN